MFQRKFLIYFLAFPLCLFAAKVRVGSESLISDGHIHTLRGKRIGLITNHTAVNSKMETTVDFFKHNAKKFSYTLSVLFAPEHGIEGSVPAGKSFGDSKDCDGIPIISLYGDTGPKSLTKEMFSKVDVLIYDIQDIGSRSYTYTTTLYRAMEAAALNKKPLIVLDRPNPINGTTVDGPMLEAKWRSIVGYINVPYCHGMTIGELALFFNKEYNIGCQLTVVPMKGWQRTMTFQDTGLHWVPTSPHVPDAMTAFYYPTTGILGELQIVNIGVGYTLPFQLVGAPWIDANLFAHHLNKQHFPGVHFTPFHYRPFYGRFEKEDCHGVLIVITDPKVYKPVSTQYLLIGILKSLYPKEFSEALTLSKNRKEMFCKVNGTEEAYRLIADVKHIVYKLKGIHEKERAEFLTLRKRYLINTYS